MLLCSVATVGVATVGVATVGVATVGVATVAAATKTVSSVQQISFAADPNAVSLCVCCFLEASDFVALSVIPLLRAQAQTVAVE